jgi:hypothetical protein
MVVSIRALAYFETLRLSGQPVDLWFIKLCSRGGTGHEESRIVASTVVRYFDVLDFRGVAGAGAGLHSTAPRCCELVAGRR